MCVCLLVAVTISLALLPCFDMEKASTKSAVAASNLTLHQATIFLVYSPALQHHHSTSGIAAEEHQKQLADWPGQRHCHEEETSFAAHNTQ